MTRPFNRVLLAVFLVAITSGIVRADFVEVRRSATIKAQPERNAVVHLRPEVGTNLELRDDGQQTNGYYHVTIPGGLGTTATDGFIFRTLVRRFPGNAPDTNASGETGTTVTSDVVYRGIPENDFPEFPITVLDKDHYVIGYSEDFLNPAWVFYRIGRAVDFRTMKRPGFRIDTDTQSRVRTQDYTNSGFDRGHMAPNFAMLSRFGFEGARSTFVMSNVCPQFHALNDGQWGDLEEWIAGRKPPNATADNFIRGWADEFGEVWVVVGPLFEEERDPLDSGITVPSGFFCIVIDEQGEGNPRALAFIMPHVDQRVDGLTQFLSSIDEIENRAGLDFFHELPNAIEDQLERNAATELWPLPVAPN